MYQGRRRWFVSLSVCAVLGACGGTAGNQAESAAAGSSSAGGGSTALGGSAASGGETTTNDAGAPLGAGAASSAGSSADTMDGGSDAGGSAGGGGAPSGGAPSGGAPSGGAGGSSSVGGAAGAGGSPLNQNDLPATTLHLAGDSTVMYYPPPSAQEGWGQELGQYLISKVTIDNQALGGTSVETFHTDGRWARITAALKPGDFVMADFGINDSGGVDGRGVTPTDFQTLMSQMNDEVKAKQATFIIVTPSALQYWSGGMDTNARLAPYVAVENMLGTTDKIPIDDLNARSLTFLNMIGQTAAMQIYINGDKAHFTKMGATQMAKFVATELTRIGSPLAAYLN